MSKERVVIFDAIGKAKVYITDAPELFACEPGQKMFINPDLSYVVDIPPELWNLEGDKIVPLFDPVAIKQRLADIGVKSFTNMADAEIKKNVSKLVDIPERIDSIESALVCAIERNKKEMFDEFRDLNLHVESRYLAHSSHVQAAIFRATDEAASIMRRVSLWAVIGVSILVALNMISIGLHFVK
jgi:hypothetical protein